MDGLQRNWVRTVEHNQCYIQAIIHDGYNLDDPDKHACMNDANKCMKIPKDSTVALLFIEENSTATSRLGKNKPLMQTFTEQFP